MEKVCVIGGLRLQNELIADHIRKATGMGAIVPDRHKGAPVSIPTSQSMMILWDFSNNEVGQLWPRLPGSVGGVGARNPVAVFNVPPAYEHLADLVIHGVRGIFYTTDSVDVLIKGLLAIRKGELWVSRRQLEACLLSGNPLRRDQSWPEFGLTRREAEVLAGIASGATNEEIAENLCISISTVKTHNYRIFKKIGANNRMQASLWALKHLQPRMEAPRQSEGGEHVPRPAGTARIH